MTSTYTITKGHQYDREGATVTDGTLRTNYSNGATELAMISGSGPAMEHEDAVAAAVLRVIASGQSETLTLGTVAMSETLERNDIDECMMYDPQNGCPLHSELCARWAR